MVIVAVAALLIGGVIGLLVGIAVPSRQEARKTVREEFRKAGLSENSVKLLGRAAKVLRRLDGLTDLDGDLAVDILSPESKKQVSEWLADYRKGLNQL
ncbi:hypothetical protein [Paractinoplanes toevensis]|uniref:Uncharacterized protein n=1 Tax=Paractinoplanes toevensis TaxID=571911 RepID=A0A919T6D9_9ACTN|nr:hypothetical protein [Actinoplanes toevensis]GIM88846.1 hypothetical protein Ato02nite_006390 [Actinoplanes toevensis]